MRDKGFKCVKERALARADEGLSEDRVRKGADKLRIAMSAKQQGRLDGFFKMSGPSGAVNPMKRKAEMEAEACVAARSCRPAR